MELCPLLRKWSLFVVFCFILWAGQFSCRNDGASDGQKSIVDGATADRVAKQTLDKKTKTSHEIDVAGDIGPANVASSGKAPTADSQTADSQTADSQSDRQALQPSGSGPTLFEKLDSVNIGVDFVHRWKPRTDYERTLLKTAFTGGGVCLGDYDRDGYCDVLLTSPHGGGRLYRNLGHFHFEDATDDARLEFGDAWLTGATFVDVNGDHWQDLVVCAYNSPNFLFVNNGDGTFRNQADTAQLGFVGASIKTTFADYDLDGDLDAFLVTNRREPDRPVKIKYEGSQGKYRVAEQHSELALVINLPNGEQKFTKAGQRDHLFQNQLAETGHLTFRDVSAPAGMVGAYHGLDATWWDYNGDHYPDLYVANDFTDPDQLWKNNGDGTFSNVLNRAVPSTPWFCMAATPGDLNNDGRLDLFTTDMAGTTHYRQKKAMGSMDAVAWFLDTAEPRQFMRNALFINTGTERFLEVAQMAGVASSDWSWSVQIADFDNDGWEDIFVTNGFPRDYMDSDFNVRLIQQGQQANPFAWHQAPELREENIAFRNLGDLSFEKVGKAWGLSEIGVSFGAAVGDLDNDGDLDIVVNNYDAAPSFYRNTSTADRLSVRLHQPGLNPDGLGAKVEVKTDSGTQTRYLANGSGFMSANEIGVWFGLGDPTSASETAVSELKVTWSDGTETTRTDLKAGFAYSVDKTSGTRSASKTATVAEPMFVESDLHADVRHEETPFDDFRLQPLLPNKLSQLGPGMACADVNGDRRDDLYIGGAAGFPGTLRLRTSEGRFRDVIVAALLADAKCEDMGSLFVDVDSDGDRDLYVVSGGVEAEVGAEELRDRLYLNQGVSPNGDVILVRSNDLLPDLRDSGGPVTAADFDRDGDLDLFVGGRVVPGAYPTSPSSRLLVNDKGHFTDGTASRAPELASAGMVTGAVWSDIDADGWIDLILTTEYGPIRVFANQKGQLRDISTKAGTATLLGWWNGIAAGDVDADGDIDFAVSNLGWNTKYHPSVEKPQQIYFADFDKSGSRRIVEAKQGAVAKQPDEIALLPVRGLSCSSNAMPFVRKKFPSFHAFAVASLADIYGAKELEDAFRVEANTASSGLLVNRGDGQFEFRELPRLAQVAPGFGIGLLYANDDDVLDLFIAQNFYTPQRETGRMAGGVGQLLLGAGDGTFDVVASDVSGLVIPGDAKSLAVVDLDDDGRQDLVVGQNDAPLRSFLNVRGRSVVRVRLRGPDGNQDAIGARIRIDRQPVGSAATIHGEATRNSQTWEVTMGQGYLTQQPAEVALPASSDRPISIVVTWPDGTESRHAIQCGQPIAVVRRP